MKTMWTGLGGVVLAAAFPFAAPDFPVHRDATSTVTLHVAGTGERTVDLRTISGTIRVTTDRRDDVRLSVTRHTDAEREQDLAAAEREVQLDTSEQGASVSAIVHARDQRCGESDSRTNPSWWDRPRYHVRLDLTAVIPQGSRVRLCTINGESIVATGTFADFDVSNVNGRVELTGVRGSGRAVTVNGPVMVTFAESPRDVSEFRTVNGDVIVTFPRDLAANLRLKTSHGELLTDFDVQPLASQPVVTRRNGGVTYHSGGDAYVRVGRGGPELRFDTLNGSVRVLRASR